jgi:acetate kinase
VNVGSSSLRLDVWEVPGTSPQEVLEADGIGGSDGTVVVNDQPRETATFPHHAAALDALLARLPKPVRLDCIGHRLVHGGPKHRDQVWVDDRVLADLDGLVRFVLLHVPPALRAIRLLAAGASTRQWA